MKNLLLASAAILAAAPAVAADLPTKKAPPPVPVATEYDWTGIYFGGNIGWAWGNTNYNSYNTVNGLWVDGGSNNVNSFVGGGQVGYRYMFPQQFVIGAEASLDWSTSNSTASAQLVSNKYYEWTDYSSGLGGHVVAVGGYAWEDFLPYIKAGWAWTDSTATHFQNYGTIGSVAAPGAAQAEVYRSGWTIGGGLAYHFWTKWEVFGQYMYSNYGSADTNYLALQRASHSSLNTNAITFGVNFKM